MFRSHSVLIATLTALALALCLGSAAPASADPAIAGEIARLRSTLGQSAAQEQQCLAGATRPVWAAPVAEDLRLLRERIQQVSGAGGDSAVWKELLKKAEELESQARQNTRTGADLLTAQHTGLTCLERFSAQREAARGSLELALAEPAAYLASVNEARSQGRGPLTRDLVSLRQSALALAAALKAPASDGQIVAAAGAVREQTAACRRRHVAVLETEANRALADPVLRAAELIVAAAEARERERQAGLRAEGAQGAERQAAVRERAEAARLRQVRVQMAERLLAESAALKSE